MTISGSAVSTTPSQNTVKFNGTTGSVTSSTSTQIVASVSSGATTGLISVTVGTNTATSTKVFTVAASQAPTVTGFSPAIGSPGTSVSVTGTNFQTAGNDKTKFNITLANVTSATATSLSVVEPSGGSGHLAVSTPYGTGTSSGDFFIPPSPWTVSSVGFTGRMSVGGTSTISLGASQVGLMLFDGTAGQRVSAVLSNGTFPAGDCPPTLAFVGATGTPLQAGSCYTYFSTRTGFVDATFLPLSASYTVEVGDNSSGGGSAGVKLYNVVDLTAPITVGGSTVYLTTNTPGQSGSFTFTLSQSQKVSSVNYFFDGGCYCTALISYILDATGSTVASGQTGTSFTWGVGTSYIDSTTLPAGNYALVLHAGTPNTGVQYGANRTTQPL